MKSSMDSLLSAAGKKLGISPEQLKASLEKGDLSSALRNMPKADAERLQEVMRSPEAMKKILSGKNAQELMKKAGK